MFLVRFISLFYWGLSQDPGELPSQLIKQSAPEFSVNELLDPQVVYTADIFKGKISLLNIWASWCPACYDEHPYWKNYAKMPDLQIIGLNYSDKKASALNFLRTQGNPYEKCNNL